MHNHMITYNDTISILKIAEKAPEFFGDFTFDLYLKLSGMNSNFLIELKKMEVECARVVLMDKLMTSYYYVKYIHEYIENLESKLINLENCSSEQLAYITNPNLTDTKLIACAGSGKTSSIINRIKFLVDHEYVKKENIFAVTFSRAAAADFRRKISDKFPDYDNFCNMPNFSTIDSLAKSFLCRFKTDKSKDVEILSVAFMNYLKDLNKESIASARRIKNIKHIFVDEAQDLNQVQISIVRYLQDKFNTSCELIGDPNQNIYQFRNSSSQHLINYHGETFYLTNNYRSTTQLIRFAEYFKSNPGKPTVPGRYIPDDRIVVMSEHHVKINKFIIEYIRKYGEICDISNIAIVCPTRGVGGDSIVGLAGIAHLLDSNNIPFNGMYNDTLSKYNQHVSKDKLDGKVNLLTYHGTKGLEFDVVFVMDFYMNLFNIVPTESDYLIHRYLLYVVLSRAKRTMFICNSTDTKKNINNWIEPVPLSLYETQGNVFIKPTDFREDDPMETTDIEKLIDELSPSDLDKIDDNIRHSYTHHIRVGKKLGDICLGRDMHLFKTFTTKLFHLQYSLHHKKELPVLPIIESILKDNMIPLSENDHAKIDRFYKKNSDVSSIKKIARTLGEKLDIDKINNQTIFCTVDMQKIIADNMESISEAYEKYTDPESYSYDYSEILEDFFYLVVVEYSYVSNHLYHINNKAQNKIDTLYKGVELFEESDKLIRSHYYIDLLEFNSKIRFDKMKLTGNIFATERKHDRKSGIVHVICRKEIKISDYVLMIVNNFCKGYMNNSSDTYTNDYVIINLFTGIVTYDVITFSPKAMFSLFKIFAEIGNLKIDNLKLVYDLETTGFMKLKSADEKGSTLDGTISVSDMSNLCNTYIFPDIIEIYMVDIDTKLVVIDNLVKPYAKIKEHITDITTITNDMVKNKPKQSMLVDSMNRSTNILTNCSMIAHNGSMFDHKILVGKKLILDKNIRNFTFYDTMNCPEFDDFSDRKLGTIYRELLGTSAGGLHRAKSDVKALIKIIEKMDIQF